MNEKHINPLPEQVIYRQMRERYSHIDVVTLRKSSHVSTCEKATETQTLKEEINDIIFKSAHLIKQLRYKARRKGF